MIDYTCPDCLDPGPHQVIGDYEDGWVEVRCGNCRGTFDVVDDVALRGEL